MTKAQEPSASLQDWIAVLAGALGALIATLDISIVNSALPHILGEIGATGTEGTWIPTGYLVSEVVMIPLSAWLVRLLGLRTLLLACGLFFTLFSMICGVSHDLPTMILGRVGQGFFGGALIPTAQTIVRTRLPARQMPIGMSLFGLIVLLGPLGGPIIGGWLTDNVSWEWCFFLNVPVAAALAALLLLGLPHEKAKLGELREADWLGIAGMAVGLSSLTTILEEGQRERWFESPLIVGLSVAAVAGLTAVIVGQFTSRRPVLKLRLLLNRSFGGVILIATAVGMVLYGVVYILPQFLSGIAGYGAEQSGEVLFISGLPAFLMMPLLPRLMGKANLQVTVILGLVCLAASCFFNLDLTAQSGGPDFVVPQLLRGVGQMLAMMPLNQASVGAVAREDAGDAAGLYNMARNLGGSLGLALLGVFIDRRLVSHVDALTGSITANSQIAQYRIATQAAALGGGDPAIGRLHALGQLSGLIQQQALVITYSECFLALGVLIIGLLPLALLLRAPKRAAPAAEIH